ncbi:amino acid ABC transporter substrate-binding protein, PAAT family [Actinomadura meyerae]|jgi:glutamate transport system substrate-binding protein|uniref:Amino acid ABC transporter substrate-binding protein, PAAT family n=1 Tax=Actinomadura meyerae TaxID=240840 RepID=A0A239MGK0_9ACTN|nr:glutamate ABC transporter substrate-binding protein [Actinomadura meyerae]SNT41630.1 amino acid ABC transporter substrate-binding protein, PAAT family [Actinomadura meyerae]
MRATTITRAAAAAALAAAVLAGCGLGGTEKKSLAGKDSLVIGVKEDQPALGVKRPDGTYEGFDVDVATYIAGRLGVPKSRITWRTTNSSVREEALAKGTVDMIVATYSITPKRKMKVTFGGPYYVAHQDTFVRADAASIRDVRDLKDKRICEVRGSNSWRRVIEERKVAAKPVTVDTYGACMDALAAGRLDAVSTDDLILAGFAAGRPGRMINAPFTDEKYGVGLRKGDLKGCEEVNRAITAMYQDGTAERLLTKWFGKSGLKLTTSVPQFEGCT